MLAADLRVVNIYFTVFPKKQEVVTFGPQCSVVSSLSPVHPSLQVWVCVCVSDVGLS